MSDSDVRKFRGRKMNFLLYPDDVSHMQALDLIKQSFDCAYILHDKDQDDQGQLKKAHYHVVAVLGNNARWNTALADMLGIKVNYIQECNNLDRSLEYLIHFNDEDKAQYPIDAVHGPLKGRLKQLISVVGKSESDKVCELLDFIDSFDGYLSVSTFSRYCAQVGMWDIFRRAGAIFIKCVDDHNKAC